jgi:hypothetical protein
MLHLFAPTVCWQGLPVLVFMLLLVWIFLLVVDRRQGQLLLRTVRNGHYRLALSVIDGLTIQAAIASKIYPVGGNRAGITLDKF